MKRPRDMSGDDRYVAREEYTCFQVPSPSWSSEVGAVASFHWQRASSSLETSASTERPDGDGSEDSLVVAATGLHGESLSRMSCVS